MWNSETYGEVRCQIKVSLRDQHCSVISNFITKHSELCNHLYNRNSSEADNMVLGNTMDPFYFIILLK